MVVIMNDRSGHRCRRSGRGRRGNVRPVPLLGIFRLAFDTMPPAKETSVVMTGHLRGPRHNRVAGRCRGVVRPDHGGGDKHQTTQAQPWRGFQSPACRAWRDAGASRPPCPPSQGGKKRPDAADFPPFAKGGWGGQTTAHATHLKTALTLQGIALREFLSQVAPCTTSTSTGGALKPVKNGIRNRAGLDDILGAAGRLGGSSPPGPKPMHPAQHASTDARTSRYIP